MFFLILNFLQNNQPRHLLAALAGLRLTQALSDGVLQHDLLLVIALVVSPHRVLAGPAQHLVGARHVEHGVVESHGGAAVLLLDARHARDWSVQRLDVGEGDPGVDDVEERDLNLDWESRREL